MDVSRFHTDYSDDVIALLRRLAVIPAPSYDEGERASFLLECLHELGLTNAFIDDRKNVIVEIGNVSNGATLIMAHTDIVFSRDVRLEIVERDGRLFCPGVGDDTVHVAMLVFCCLFAAKKASEHGFIFAFNACEEGEGNLFGCKGIMERYGSVVKEMITFDGYLDVINDTAVGSKRFRIFSSCCGGHSFRDFGSENAIATISRLVCELDALPCGLEGITTYNFGVIKGGSTVNSIAERCELLYEFRSDSAADLKVMENNLFRILEGFPSVEVEVIGVRPCAQGVDKKAQDALIRRAEDIFGDAKPRRFPASTDCNVPLSMGIPSICVGFIRGGGAHTVGEFIEKQSVIDGFLLALRFIDSFLGE